MRYPRVLHPALLLVSYAAAQTVAQSPYLDPTLPVETRVRDLVSQWQGPDSSAAFATVIAKARAADAVIFVGGITAQLEGEEMRTDYDGFKGGDRTRIELPIVQQQLLEALQATGKPVVFVLRSGSAVATPWASAHVNAILEAWYPGQAGGTAVADVLLGRTNPAGRSERVSDGAATVLGQGRRWLLRWALKWGLA